MQRLICTGDVLLCVAGDDESVVVKLSGLKIHFLLDTFIENWTIIVLESL